MAPQGPEDTVQSPLDKYNPESEDFAAPVLPSGYFDGYDLTDLPENERRAYNIHRDDGAPLHRHSYLYKVEFPTMGGGKDRDDSQNGIIELRARTWTYRPNLPERYKEALKGVAHKAATMFNSTIETPAYAGYLDGFLADVPNPRPGTPKMTGERWETEDKRHAYDETEAAAGKVDWNVEIYNDDQDLSGIATGLAFPWRVTETTEPPKPPQHITPHKWEITYNDSLEKYDVHPPGRKAVRRRYQPGGAGHNKTVYINGLPVGNLDSEGRTWLFPDYSSGDTFTGRGGLKQYDRAALVDRTGATWQALRDGGTLYLTGETENRINLVTAAEKPPGYKAGDPDNVSVSMDVEPGGEGGTYRTLDLVDRDESVALLAERDIQVLKHLGKSAPEYRHSVVREWSI